MAAAGTFSATYTVLPEHKRVFLDMISLGLNTGTTGRATVQLDIGGVTTNLVDDYPLTADDQNLVFYPQIHLDVGMSINFTIANVGAADTGKALILGVK